MFVILVSKFLRLPLLQLVVDNGLLKIASTSRWRVTGPTAEVHQKPVPFYGSRKQISSVCAGYLSVYGNLLLNSH